jgi:hypothetical protein
MMGMVRKEFSVSPSLSWTVQLLMSSAEKPASSPISSRSLPSLSVPSMSSPNVVRGRNYPAAGSSSARTMWVSTVK